MILNFFKKIRSKFFLTKSAKTVLAYSTSYDILIDKLNDDIESLNQFKIIKESPIQQSSRLRLSRQTETIKEEIVKIDNSNKEKLKKVVEELNFYHIYSQLKIIKYFKEKFENSIYVKYLFDGENIDEKLNGIEKKCQEVYSVGKVVIVDESVRKLFEEGYIQIDEDLEIYKKVVEKYIK